MSKADTQGNIRPRVGGRYVKGTVTKDPNYVAPVKPAKVAKVKKPEAPAVDMAKVEADLGL